MDMPSSVATITASSEPTGSTPTPARQNESRCPECNGAGYFRYDVPVSHPRFGKIFPCNNPVHDAERKGTLAKMQGLRPEDLTKTLDDLNVNDYNRAMIEAAQDIIKNPFGWLYIWGGPGNAKSEVLIAIVNELTRLGVGPGRYTNFGSIINYMRDSFNEQKQTALHGRAAENGYMARFEQLKQIRVLCIDEMDKVRSTPFADEFRFDFLDDRYRSGTAGETVTVFAGNTDPATFPDAIYDRIRDGRFRIVENRAGSARPFMQRS